MNAPARQDRSVARLAAVQALYQLETTGAGVEDVIREFREHRFEHDLDGQRLAPGDEVFFSDLARGVVEAQAEVDAAIKAKLAKDWKMSRLDATARAALRCGVFELLRRPDVPREVVIDEYVEIAKSFFDSPEPAFINGVLDAVARQA